MTIVILAEVIKMTRISHLLCQDWTNVGLYGFPCEKEEHFSILHL